MRRRLSLSTCVAALACLGVLAGCAAAEDATDGAAGAPTSTSTSAPTDPASASTAATPTTASRPSSPSVPAPRTITVTVTGRTVTPAPAVVALARGEVLRLVVTADHDDELHAHGFDVAQALVAGRPTTVELTADEPGRYEVETHEPALRLLVVQVR